MRARLFSLTSAVAAVFYGFTLPASAVTIDWVTVGDTILIEPLRACRLRPA